MTAVFQFVPSYISHDAVGTHTTAVSRLLSGLGLRTHIYVVECRNSGAKNVSPYRSFPGARKGEPTYLLYQLSIGSPLGEWLARRPEDLIVNYHNVTPARFLAGWESYMVPHLLAGRHQLAALAPRTRLGIADSHYNEDELVAAGYQQTTTVPVLVDYEALGATSDQRTEADLAAAKRRGGHDWLFVGRLYPNKAQHQLIRAFAVYRRLYDPRARLHLVGHDSSRFYRDALAAYAATLDLDDAVFLTGSLPQPQLVAHYRQADVFVSLSEHEGFCIPLLEAMWHRVPVVALGSSAVPETVGSAGLVLPMTDSRQPDAAVVAAAVWRVLGDDGLRERLVRAGTARVAAYDVSRTSARFASAISEVVGS